LLQTQKESVADLICQGNNLVCKLNQPKEGGICLVV
jgi:hypothetical protein